MSDQTQAPIRWKWLFVLLALCALALILTRFLNSEDAGMRNALTIMVAMGSGALVLVWLLAFSRLGWKVRLGGLAAVLVLGWALTKLVRVRGYSGDLIPVLAWGWAPESDEKLSAPTIASAPEVKNPGPDNEHEAESSLILSRPKKSVQTLPFEKPFTQFLGPQRNGWVPREPLSEDWYQHPPKQRWRKKIGLGWSSFAVFEGKAVTQEQRGKNEWVICYELASGEILWAQTDEARFSERMGGDGPRATPTIHNQRVYALGATGILNCLDIQTGKRYWSINTLQECGHENLVWGKCSSPLIVDQTVVVSLGKSKDRALAAYHIEHGKLAWRAGDDKPSYSSPILATVAGRRQIVSINADSVSGHDPETGSQLWSHPFPGGPAKCANPVLVGMDHILAGSGYGVGAYLLKIQNNDKGLLTATQIWRSKQMKTKFTTAIIRGEFAYGLDDGTLACIDLKEGKRQWKKGHYGHGQVLGVGEVLLIQCESGDLAVVDADPKGYNERARYEALKGKTWNTPALAGRYLLVRNDLEAICFELPSQVR